MNDVITLNQGSGGKLTRKLIRDLFSRRFGIPEPLTDSALIRAEEDIVTFTTDSYVVNPLFFPGGNIGKLAVCGTVNDLAVSGATPLSLSASFIIEEGMQTSDLDSITRSMAEEAGKANIRIVTGDTKVVERGKCDKLFITTSGTGTLKSENIHISTAQRIKPGDVLIINGPVGAHALAVLSARNSLSFNTPVLSDCASLNHLINRAMNVGPNICFMRDLTRGGLASVLNELVEMTGLGIIIKESSVPVDDPVKGLCEMLGFDPLYLANEGKVLIVTDGKEAGRVLDAMRSDPLGEQSVIIGEIVRDERHLVVLDTSVGGKRILDEISGEQIPRIC